MRELTTTEIAMLDFANTHWPDDSVKEAAILETFGIAPRRFTMRVNAIIDKPESLAHDPLLVRRLRRLREQGGAESRLATRLPRP